MISCPDNNSRFIPGSTVHHSPTAEHDQAYGESLKEYRKPDQILTDRVTQFYPAREGASEFTEFYSKNKTEYVVANTRTPSTIGKIEAFGRVHVYEWWMFSTNRWESLEP
jgi:hypothetical protein